MSTHEEKNETITCILSDHNDIKVKTKSKTNDSMKTEQHTVKMNGSL